MNLRIKQRILFIIVAHFILLGSCKKEYTDIYETRYTDTIQIQADNYLKAFSVVDTLNTDTIKASLAEDNIIVYWPIWKTKPEKIAPLINIPTKASISPAIGDSILFQSDVVYTITAESGETKTYTLKVIDLQQPFYFKENRTSLKLGETIALNGDYFVRGYSTTIFLEEIDGDRLHEIPVPDAGVAANGLQISAKIPTTVDTALYRIRLVHGGRSAYTSDDYDTVQIGYAQPSLSAASPAVTVKQGETFTINGAELRSLSSMRMFKQGEATLTYQPLIIESYTLTSVTVKVPENALIGSYDMLQSYTVYANHGVTTSNLGSVTIIEK